MRKEIWARVDEYVGGLLAPHDEALQAAIEAAEAAGLPSIQVSPRRASCCICSRGRSGRGTVLEFGTLGGYSTIWLGRALLRGRPSDHARGRFPLRRGRRGSIERAGLAELVELRVGAALETLPKLEEEGAGPFDLVFIDADKVHSPDYFAWSLERTRPGGLIVVDNVVRDGSIVEPDDDASAHAQRRLHEEIAADARVSATTIQTVGVKGYDGFTIGLVTPG